MTIPEPQSGELTPDQWAEYLLACALRQAAALKHTRDLNRRVVSGGKLFP